MKLGVVSSELQEQDSEVVVAVPLGGWVKRGFDILSSASLIVAVLPLLALIALVVRLQDGGPSLYRHARIGLGGRRFYCLKFRSMAVNSEALLTDHLGRNPAAMAEWSATHKLKKDPRITPIGSFLRKSSMDELPQLLNIISGEMSVVGPRPIVAGEVERYGTHFATYCKGRPGLTGPWQISGRSELSYSDRVSLDIDYAATWSFVGDLWIIIRTIPAVLSRRGSY